MKLTIFIASILSPLVCLLCYAENPNLRALSESASWRALLHAEKDFLASNYSSQVDSKSFFLAKNGKSDLLSELNANIDHFISDQLSEKDRLQAICKFPARYEWLRENLPLTSSPPVEDLCSELVDFIKSRNTVEVTLIFAESYLDNPASMFGHTFLRFANKDLPKSRLLDPTLSFAADARKSSGISMALNGLFGGFKGRFYTTPYYVRIKQYEDIDHRDLWEYPLRLTRDELRTLNLHLWELRQTYFDYYFIDENCSDQLLSFLKVIRPNANFYQNKLSYVIPVETIRVLTELGLIEDEPRRRISGSATLANLERELSDPEKEKVKYLTEQLLADEEFSLEDYSLEQQVKLLDTADAFLAFRQSKESQEYGAPHSRIASLRSKLGSSGSKQKKAILGSSQPLNGHRPSRIRTTFGDSDDRSYLGISARPALHSLSDPFAGYLPNSELVFLEPELRFYPAEENLSLERFTLLQLLSLPERKFFFRPYSWGVVMEFKRVEIERLKREMSFAPVGLYGFSYNVGTNLRASILAKLSGTLAESLNHSVEIAPASVLQLQWIATDRLQLLAEGQIGQPLVGDYSFEYGLSLSETYRVTDSLAQIFKISQSRNFDHSQSIIEIGCQYYFSVY